MKHLILAAALLAFSAPAFAGGDSRGGTVGGTSAFSGSAVGVANCNCPGRSSAQALSGNASFGKASIGHNSQQSVTGSTSVGFGQSSNGHFLGVAAGGGEAFTFGPLSGGHRF